MKSKTIIHGMIFGATLCIAGFLLSFPAGHAQDGSGHQEPASVAARIPPSEEITVGRQAGPIVSDHRCCRLSAIPQDRGVSARENLQVAYFHDGSDGRLTADIAALLDDANPPQALPVNENFFSNMEMLPEDDSGGSFFHPDYNAWAAQTRAFLAGGRDHKRKIVIWSRNHEGGDDDTDGVFIYLVLMNQLEQEYPGTIFVYTTGFPVDNGSDNGMNQSNAHIRRHCLENNKILLDFADMEGHDPDEPDNHMYFPGDRDGESDGIGSLLFQDNRTVLKFRAFWCLMEKLTAWEVAAQATYAISGTITLNGNGLSGVTLAGLPGEPVTNGSGQYTTTVDENWSGTATPGLTGYVFTPGSRSYNNVSANQTDQNYTATVTPTYTISGRITMDNDGSSRSGVKMYGLPGEPETDANGYYSATVNQGFSGDVDPERSGYFFSPHKRSYSNIDENKMNQDYNARNIIEEIDDHICFIGVVRGSSASRPLNALRAFLGRWRLPL